MTRHGRVVFYDYDEIQDDGSATSARSRRRATGGRVERRTLYSVAPNDIFPEEFATFLLQKPQGAGDHDAVAQGAPFDANY